MERLMLLVLALALPTLQCPSRDPLAQEEEARLCGPPCTPGVPCRQATKQCLCDGPCGPVCLDPDLRCSALSSPTHGRIEVPLEAALHAEARYECDPGYLLKGPSVRRCRGDSSWTPPDPSCQPDPFQCSDHDLISSRPPWALLPRQPRRPFYSHAQAVPFICSRAARLSSGRQGTLKCVKGRWQSTRGQCQLRTCPPLKDLANGRSQVQEGEEAHFSCEEGFRLVGPTSVPCRAGEWIFARGMPFCHPVEFEDDKTLDWQEPSYDPPVVPATTEAPTTPLPVPWEPVHIHPVPVLASGGHCIVPHAPNLLISQSEESATHNQHLVDNGTCLVFSCPDTRHFLFQGSRQRTCLGGAWTGSPASCSPISPGLLHSPPGLAVRADPQAEEADLSLDNDGSIRVPIGTHLHIDCFWPRLSDTPDPEWSHPSPREEDAFHQAWDAQGEHHTLTIWHLQEEDGGSYTCKPSTGSPHSVTIQVVRPDEETLPSTYCSSTEDTSVRDFNTCLFERRPNIEAWTRGRWLNVRDQVLHNATVHLRCKDPGRYILHGPNSITCVHGQWTAHIEESGCHLLVRNSDHMPPPIAWHSSHPTAVLHDATLLVPPGATLTLDCLWVMAEPGHGWYHPVWMREGQQPHDRVQLPAEIVALSGPSPSGTPLHYGYRVSVTPVGQPDHFTCLTPSEARHSLRIYVTAFCLLSSVSLPAPARPELLQPVYPAGESIPVLLRGGCSSHVSCMQNGTWGALARPRCPP